jgi:hypothetical protein
MGEISLVPFPSKISIIPFFPFREDNFVADDYLLFFFPFTFNFDFSYFSLTFLQWYCYVNLQVDSDLTIKKPAKKSFRVLAGMSYKPKKLCATFLLIYLYTNLRLKARKYARSIQSALECGDAGYLFTRHLFLVNAWFLQRPIDPRRQGSDRWFDSPIDSSDTPSLPT